MYADICFVARYAVCAGRVNLQLEKLATLMTEAHFAYAAPELEKLFEDNECCQLKPDSSEFWFCLGGLKRFVEREGNVPLEGAIPDMHADSAQYLALQRLYREKAEADAAIGMATSSFYFSFGIAGQIELLVCGLMEQEAHEQNEITVDSILPCS